MKPLRVENETVKNWAKTTYKVPKNASVQDVCFSAAFIAAHEMAADLLDARELIKEMRERLVECKAQLEYYEQEVSGEDYNSPILNEVIEKTKDYA